jgi:3-oxoacyl-[acyl-carrier protein] reductase
MKKVVITGGNGDIAKAIGNLLKAANYEVYLPTREELDVKNLQLIHEYFSRIVPDILINNAGAILLEDISQNNILAHKNVIDVNLTAVFACTGEVLKHNPNAQIINIGSSAGTKVHASWSSYCATKAAVIMATKCWAEEGVDTICISPGRAETKMRKSMYPNENPDTLMKPKDFAKVVLKAVQHHYETGLNIDVNVNNVKELINE